MQAGFGPVFSFFHECGYLEDTRFVVDVDPVLENFVGFYFTGMVAPAHLDHLN